MSATNRGSDRIAHDAYPTPPWCVHRLLEACPLPGGVWLEPCAGEGAIIAAVNAAAAGNDKPQLPTWYACELQATCGNALNELIDADRIHAPCDYLAQPFEGADVIITNPPFDQAFPIAQKAVSEASCVALLLRLNWLGSGERSGRSAWLRKHTPDVYVLPNRPSFAHSMRCKACGFKWLVPWNAEDADACVSCGIGRCARAAATDATEYAWFVWGLREGMARGNVHREASLRILAETPAIERRGVRPPRATPVMPQDRVAESA